MGKDYVADALGVLKDQWPLVRITATSARDCTRRISGAPAIGGRTGDWLRAKHRSEEHAIVCPRPNSVCGRYLRAAG